MIHESLPKGWRLTLEPSYPSILSCKSFAFYFPRCRVLQLKTSVTPHVCWSLKIGLRKWNYFRVKEFFSDFFFSKTDVKIYFRIITINHAADSKIASQRKIDFRAIGTHEFHPTAWELMFHFSNEVRLIIK